VVGARPAPGPPHQPGGADQHGECRKAGQAEPLAELPPGRPCRRADRDVQQRPGGGADRAPPEEAAVAHAGRPGHQRHDRVDDRDEPCRRHRPAPATAEEPLGLVPCASAKAPSQEAGPQETVAVAPAQQVADRLPDQRAERARRDQQREPTGAGDGGAGQQHHGVPRHQQADEERRLQAHEQPGEQAHHGRMHAGERGQRVVDHLEHAARLLVVGGWPDACPSHPAALRAGAPSVTARPTP
jgi:hypothetical protein